MDKLFNFDSKLYKFGTLLGDLIILTILWLLTSLPIITIGASTTALYYVTTRQLSDREGYVSRDFFRSFKQNFLPATLITLIFIAIYLMVFINIRFLEQGSLFFPLQFVILFETTITAIYVFPLLSRFELKALKVLKTAFFLANKHVFTTITCAVLFVSVILICFKNAMLISVCAGAYAILTSLIFMNIFKKYVPEMDKDDVSEKY